MFEVNTSTSLNYRYSIDRLKDPNLEKKIGVWIQNLKSTSMLVQLSNRLNGGHVHRKKLLKEFREVLHCHAYFLDERSEKFKGSSIRADILMRLHNASSSTDRSINFLENNYKISFNEDILTAQQLTKLTHCIQAISLANVLEGLNTQRCVIDRKKFACRHGGQHFAADLKSGCDDLPSRRLSATGKHRQLPAKHRTPQLHALPVSPSRELEPYAFAKTHAGSAAKRERSEPFVQRVGPQAGVTICVEARH